MLGARESIIADIRTSIHRWGIFNAEINKQKF